MGMAAIGVALWKYAMKYSPRNPSYFNRDRFVLSNGMYCVSDWAVQLAWMLTLDSRTHMSVSIHLHASGRI
jgi:transketolase